MKNNKKKALSILIICAILTMLAYIGYVNIVKKSDVQVVFTNLQLRNLSKQDSVKVYVTLQAPNSVVGIFGIQDTIGSCSKGYFYAHKDSVYYSNVNTELLGVVIGFGADNMPCKQAIDSGFVAGINIFECSINTPFEVFEISCEDGVNSILRESVSDTINWSTGDSDFQQNFRLAENTFPIINNVGIRGVFPYRCTDCKDMKAPVPENCFNLKDSCNTQRICQVARTNNIGGTIFIDYISPAFQICNTK